jgi:hypothetical protein
LSLAINQHQAQFDNLERRIGILYADRLDGRIAVSMYDSKAGEYRAQQQTILRALAEIRTTAPAPIEDALHLIRLTSRAASLFLEQEGSEQRRLLRTLVKTDVLQL